jgi:Tol biopolymer transport system component
VDIGALEAGGPVRAVARRFLPWALALIATGAAAWLAGLLLWSVDQQGTRIASSILPPPGMGFDLRSQGLALTPDGTQLAFTAVDSDGVSSLWVRRLDHTDAHRFEGTEGAQAPFWSPDGRYLGFFANGKIRKLEVATGITESISDYEDVFGATWGVGGDILICNEWFAPPLRVPAGGGDPIPLVAPAEGYVFEWPSFLPDGKHFLYHARPYGSDARMGQIHLGSIDDSSSRLLFDSHSNAQFAAPGIVLWWHDGNLRAQRLDPERLTLEGEPAIVAAGVQFDPRSGSAGFSLSTNGMLVYQGGEVVRGDELVWFSRDGSELGKVGKVGEPGSLYAPRLSPDGRRIALDISDESNRGDIWLLDAERGSGIRFTSFPEDDSKPIWSPTGDQLAFFSFSAGGKGKAVFLRPVSGGDEARLLIQDPEVGLTPRSWSKSGELLVSSGTTRFSDLLVYSFDDGSLRPYLASPFHEIDGVFSPDGRFVAFESDESGRREVYVARYPEPTERWRASVDGGESPAWRSDGGELYFMSNDSEMMAVPVRITSMTGAPEGPAIELGEPKALFRVDLKYEPGGRQYDTLDGQRFLVNRTIRAGATRPLTLVLNWSEELVIQ